MKKATIVITNDSTVAWVNAKTLAENGKRAGVELSVKTESQLQKSDLEGDICIIGPIANYSQWKKFGLPVKKLRRGFKIGKFSFKDPLHGFSYISSFGTYPIRLVISGNSLEAYERVDNMPSFGFEYVILNDAVPEFIGNGSHSADLKTLRKSLYTPIKSNYYVFWVSENLTQEELGKVSDDELKKYDNHVEAFVKKMELSLPEKKINTYIHATQDQINTFQVSLVHRAVTELYMGS